MASWDQIRGEVRSFRASVQPTVTTIRDFVFDSARDRIYFLANDLSRSSKSPMLFRVDLPRPFTSSSSFPSSCSSSSSYSSSSCGSDGDTGTDTPSDDHTDTESDTRLSPEITQHPHQHQHEHCTEQHRQRRRQRHKRRQRESHNQHADQEDQEMDLIPFDPDSYQHFAAPVPLPIHILPGPREAFARAQAPSSASPSSFSRCSPSDTYPGNAYTAETTPSTTDQILAAAPVLSWTPVLTEEWLRHCNTHLGHSQSDRLSFFQFEPQANRLMFPYGTVIYTGDVQEDGKVDPQPAQAEHSSAADSSPNRTYSNLMQNALTAGLNLVSVSGPLTSPRASLSGSTASNLDKRVGSTGAKADPRLGGKDSDLIAFTRDQDIWVSTTLGVETQLTFCSRNKTKSDISCGIAEFVMQEEFHRFTNYYWAPSAVTATMTSSSLSSSSSSSSSSSPSSSLPVPAIGTAHLRPKERILYLQVSEAMVDLVVIPRQGMHPEYEEYRYPHTGTPNAVSDLQIVEFVARQDEEDVLPEPLHKRLWGRASLYKLFPWLEYIARFGWMPDGDSVWVQALDRRQQITAIVVVPQECFMSVAEQSESSEQTEGDLASRIRVVYEEQNDYWINVTDIMYIMPAEDTNQAHFAETDDSIQLIIASERTGYRHLYLTAHSSRSGSRVIPITAGQYQIVDKQVTVDPVRRLVYFTAKRDSVLETHLYVASYASGAQPTNVKRLTELGYSHQVTVDVEKNRFLTLYSSMDQSPACAVMHLRWGDCRRTGPTENGERSPSWCSCECQFPKISSHAFVLRKGIQNQSAKGIRRSPIVGSSTHHEHGHGRSCSESSMSTSRMDSALNGFRSGSMTSISGFLASHLLSASLLPTSKVFGQQQDSSMVVSSPSSDSRRKSSLKFAPTIQPSTPDSLPFSASSSSSPSYSASGGAINASHHPVGEFFTFMSSDNVQLHGCLYRPANYVEGQKYPTLVSIYGGPRSQMVTNEYKMPKFLRVFLATRFGHAVVMIDGRGSNDRGLEFEGQLRHRMGQIEIRDQVEGLQFLARPENGCLVDMERVAISGWSYGGYLSLMALAQYPNIFKLAIAGAPVTQWELYNTAYTERYMGLVHENKDGYTKSNVLNWADKFPDSENRLLIAHGLIDENVHFKNTETLAADLIRHNKPHQIQLYPTERHGLRDARVNEHFETLMFYWLKNYL